MTHKQRAWYGFLFAVSIFLVGIGVNMIMNRLEAESPRNHSTAGTEMAPKSTWAPAVPPPPMRKPEFGVLLDVSVTTDNGTRQYTIVEDGSVPWNEGTLSAGPRETGSGNLGFGLVKRSGDRKFFLCVMDMSAREKSTSGTIRLFSQSGGGNHNTTCLFTPN